MGSTLFLLRCSLSIRSIACRLTGGAVGALENQVGSLGLFRAAGGLVGLGGLGADVCADMDTVVEISVGDDTRLRLSSPHCCPHRTASEIHNHIGDLVKLPRATARSFFGLFSCGTKARLFQSLSSSCRHLALFFASLPMAKATAPLLEQSSMGVLLCAPIFPISPNLITSTGA